MRRALLVSLVTCSVAVATGSQVSRASSFNPDPVFPVGAISDTTSHQIAKLDRVTAKLAGHSQAVVNCWSEKDWARLQAWQSAHHQYASVDASGVTWFRTGNVELSPFVCQVLAQVLAGRLDQPLWDATAVTVLAHESAHASGIHSENRAECQAIRTEPETAGLLGVPRSLGARFQHMYRGTIYPQETPEYNSPACAAGLPGIVTPDTLGPPASLRVVRRLTVSGVPFLPHWTDIGGTYDFGPLSRCGLVSDRSNEVARFNESFVQGTGDWFGVQGAMVRTPQEYEFAVARAKALPRCKLAEARAKLRETGSSETVSLGRTPTAITRLSPNVHALHLIYRAGGVTTSLVQITITDRAALSAITLYIGPGVSLSDEVHATKATLRAMSSTR